MRLNISIEELNKAWIEYHFIPRVTRTERFGQYLCNRYVPEDSPWPALFFAKDKEAYRIAETNIAGG